MNFVDNKTFAREVATTGKPVTITCGDMSTMARVTDVNVETMPGRYNNPSSTVTLECELREVADTNTSWVRPTTASLEREIWAEAQLRYYQALAKYGRGGSRTPTFAIEKVIFNNPATIVFWMDGTKTVVKTQNDEPYDPEKGLAMAISKRALGDKGNYYDTFKKYTYNYYTGRMPVDPRIMEAYDALVQVMSDRKALKVNMVDAIEEAIGYLGEVLE